MSERERALIRELAEKLPQMSDHERGYLEGTIATAAAMSKDKEKKEEERIPVGKGDAVVSGQYEGVIGCPACISKV